MKPELSFYRNILDVPMKNQINKELLLFLVLCGLGFAAVGLLPPANSPQGEIQAKKLTQLGYGRAPHPPLSKIQAKKPTQLGYGHAPYPPTQVVSLKTS